MINYRGITLPIPDRVTVSQIGSTDMPVNVTMSESWHLDSEGRYHYRREGKIRVSEIPTHLTSREQRAAYLKELCDSNPQYIKSRTPPQGTVMGDQDYWISGDGLTVKFIYNFGPPKIKRDDDDPQPHIIVGG